jgi:dihydrofolate reductase
MRKIRYAFSVSLDGFIEAPGGDLSWGTPDRELHQHFNDQERTLDTVLYGRRLYETMAAFWPTADEDPSAPDFVVEYARIWKAEPKIVFSKTLSEVGWNSQLRREVDPDEIRRLKAQPGLDIGLGGAGLAASFMRLGLIDEYHLYFRPVILGSGKPMFTPLEHWIELELAEVRKLSLGVVMLRYLAKDAA